MPHHGDIHWKMERNIDDEHNNSSTYSSYTSHKRSQFSNATSAQSGIMGLQTFYNSFGSLIG